MAGFTGGSPEELRVQFVVPHWVPAVMETTPEELTTTMSRRS